MTSSLSLSLMVEWLGSIGIQERGGGGGGGGQFAAASELQRSRRPWPVGRLEVGGWVWEEEREEIQAR